MLKIKLDDSHPLSLKEKIIINLYTVKIALKSRKIRTQDIVNSEYNFGGYNKNYALLNFESHDPNYDVKKDRIVNCNNKHVKCSFIEFEKNYNSMLLELLSDYKDESIVEMGCGLGPNLYLLHKTGFKNLKGYDLSENAIIRAKEYSKKNQLSIDFETYDLNQPFTKNMIDGKMVFTNQCLEQCKLLMPNILKNLVNGRPKIVVNFEVDYHSSSQRVKKYMDFQGYQNNLVSELQKLENQNKIEIISIERLPLSNNVFNIPSMIIWKVK